MTLTALLDELSSLLAECDRLDDALDGIEAVHGAHVLIAQTRDRVLVVRERVAGRVQALFVAGGATGPAVMPRPPQDSRSPRSDTMPALWRSLRADTAPSAVLPAVLPAGVFHATAVATPVTTRP